MNTKAFQQLGSLITRNSPTILTGLSVAGLITTVAMAVKATPKAMRILMDEQAERGEKDAYNSTDWSITKKEIIVLTWRCYVPAALMGGFTIACIVGTNSIHLKRNAALASIYSLSETAFREYKSKVVETIGKSKDKKIQDEIAKDRITNNPVKDNEIIMTGYGDTLCYDALAGRYFKSDIEIIRQALNKVSRQLLHDDFITLNEVYSALNLRDTKMGEIVGWHVDDGLIEPEFSSQLSENGIPCLVLDYTIEPRYDYNRY